MYTQITWLFIAALFLPAFFCGGFYYGFNTAKSVFLNKSVEKANLPFSFAKKETENSYAETPQQRMARILAENVENYGTSLPQMEVK